MGSVMRILIVDAGRVDALESASLPLYISSHFPNSLDAVVSLARIEGRGVTAGSLNLIWEEEEAVRRASGGLKFNVQPGDYHISIIFKEGSLKYINFKYGGVIREYESKVNVGLGKGATHPFIEVYSRRDPSSVIEDLFPEREVKEEEFDTDLLERVKKALSNPTWIDPISASRNLVSYRVSNGGYYVGVVGVAVDGLIKETWPDSNIHVYPPGVARGIFKEITEVPPSLPLAFHAANGFMTGVEFLGVEPEHIIEAFKGYILEAERVAGKP